MTNWNCDAVRDAYPEALHGRLDAVDEAQLRAHAAVCDECRSEIALLDALHATHAALPAELHERVLRSAEMPRRMRFVPRPVLAIAATVAFALVGGSLLMQRPRAEMRAVGFVGVENAMLTGKASLDDFSVEELEQLLKEIES